MTKKSTRIVALVLYAVSLLLCLLSVSVLFDEFSVTLREEVYATPPGGRRTEIASDSDYEYHNFFDYVKRLKFLDYSAVEETLLITFIIITTVLAAAFLTVAIIRLAKGTFMSGKALKVIFLILSVFALISMIFVINIQGNMNTWKVYDIESVYLKGYSSWNIYKEQSIRGNYSLSPIIGYMLIAFGTQCAAGIINLAAKKQTVVAEGQPNVPPFAGNAYAPNAAPYGNNGYAQNAAPYGNNGYTQNAAPYGNNGYTPNAAPYSNAAPQSAPAHTADESDSTEALIRYKKLLDEGIITREEFEIKKKELLNL